VREGGASPLTHSPSPMGGQRSSVDDDVAPGFACPAGTVPPTFQYLFTSAMDYRLITG